MELNQANALFHILLRASELLILRAMTLQFPGFSRWATKPAPHIPRSNVVFLTRPPPPVNPSAIVFGITVYTTLLLEPLVGEALNAIWGGKLLRTPKTLRLD